MIRGMRGGRMVARGTEELMEAIETSMVATSTVVEMMIGMQAVATTSTQAMTTTGTAPSVRGMITMTAIPPSEAVIDRDFDAHANMVQMLRMVLLSTDRERSCA